MMIYKFETEQILPEVDLILRIPEIKIFSCIIYLYITVIPAFT